MQLFLIAPAITYLIYRFKTKMIAVLVVLIGINVVYTVVLHVEHEFTTL